MSQKAVAAVLAGIGLTLLAISGVGFMLLAQSAGEVADTEEQSGAAMTRTPGVGEQGVEFAGVRVSPEGWLHADEDGVVVSDADLAPPAPR